MAGLDLDNQREVAPMDTVEHIEFAQGTEETAVETDVNSAQFQEEFERLIDEHQNGLIRYAYRMVKNRELAQDMAQDAFIRYIKNPPRYGLPKQRASWLFRVTHNLCIDYMKRESLRRDIYDRVEKPTDIPLPGNKLVAQESWGAIEPYLNQLSENQQSVIFLFFQEDKTYKEIEAVTDLSLSNVGMLLHRGLKKIKKLMEEEGFSPA